MQGSGAGKKAKNGLSLQIPKLITKINKGRSRQIGKNKSPEQTRADTTSAKSSLKAKPKDFSLTTQSIIKKKKEIKKVQISINLSQAASKNSIKVKSSKASKKSLRIKKSSHFQNSITIEPQIIKISDLKSEASLLKPIICNSSQLKEIKSKCQDFGSPTSRKQKLSDD